MWLLEWFRNQLQYRDFWALLISFVALLFSGYGLWYTYKNHLINTIPHVSFQLMPDSKRYWLERHSHLHMNFKIFNNSPSVHMVDVILTFNIIIKKHFFQKNKIEFIKKKCEHIVASSFEELAISKEKLIEVGKSHESAYQYLENVLSYGLLRFVPDRSGRGKGQYKILDIDKNERQWILDHIFENDEIKGYKLLQNQRIEAELIITYRPSVHSAKQRTLKKRYRLLPVTDKNQVLLGWDMQDLDTEEYVMQMSITDNKIKISG